MVAPLGAAPGRPQKPAAWSTSFSPASQSGKPVSWWLRPGAVIAGWRSSQIKGFRLGGLTAEEALALERPAMTYARERLHQRLARQAGRDWQWWLHPAADADPATNSCSTGHSESAAVSTADTWPSRPASAGQLGLPHSDVRCRGQQQAPAPSWRVLVGTDSLVQRSSRSLSRSPLGRRDRLGSSPWSLVAGLTPVPGGA
jgi:hypothetical protein